MKRTWYKIKFGLIKKVFNGLLTGLANGSKHAKCCENGNYLAIFMDDAVILCDEVVKSYNKKTKTIPTNFNEKSITCKAQNLYFFTCLFINYDCIIDSC